MSYIFNIKFEGQEKVEREGERGISKTAREDQKCETAFIVNGCYGISS